MRHRRPGGGGGTAPARRVLLAACLSALPAAAPVAGDSSDSAGGDDNGHYVVSVDGRGHLLNLAPEHVEPVFDDPSQWVGMTCVEGVCESLLPPRSGMLLEMACGEGTMPLLVMVSFPKHPDDPELADLEYNPAGFLLGLLGNLLSGDVDVSWREARIVLGGSTVSAPVARQRIALTNRNDDYHAWLPADVATREIEAAAGGFLTLEVKGSPRIRRTARYRITDAFAARVGTLRRRCGTCPPDAPECEPMWIGGSLQFRGVVDGLAARWWAHGAPADRE